MRILSIETSCDETALSIVEVNGNTVTFLANALISQINIHSAYGGVFPVLAKREHQKNLTPLLKQVLSEAGMNVAKSPSPTNEDIVALLAKEKELARDLLPFLASLQTPPIDIISVTYGPGLEPALWVGINCARALSIAWNVPIVPSNHMEGHILIALLRRSNEQLPISNFKFSKKEKASASAVSHTLHAPAYPALALLISGGHTELVHIEKEKSYTIVGQTLDDAVGECFDKIARTLSLPYPGGPEISRLADIARKKNINSPEKLPRPMLHSDNLDFSFSGLKTAVLYLTQKIGTLTEEIKQGIAREAEEAITDVIIAKTRKAIETYGSETLIIGGGVIANAHLREALTKLAQEKNITAHIPLISHSTDNALMIALAGYANRDKAQTGNTPIRAQGNLHIDTTV